jgi:glycerol-3-phosphate dehydrogenase
LRHRYTWLPATLLRRYAHAYGTRIHRLLDGMSSLAGLGEDFGDCVYAAEIDYLVKREWARTPEDILWRRSKLGLHVAADTVQRLGAALPGIVSQCDQQEVRYATNA